jgi:hypothetical protein
VLVHHGDVLLTERLSALKDDLGDRGLDAMLLRPGALDPSDPALRYAGYLIGPELFPELCHGEPELDDRSAAPGLRGHPDRRAGRRCVHALPRRRRPAPGGEPPHARAAAARLSRRAGVRIPDPGPRRAPPIGRRPQQHHPRAGRPRTGCPHQGH